MVQQRALEESSRRLTAQLEVTQEEQRKDRETLKVVLQQLASVTERAPGVADATQASIRASHFLQKMTTADDVEAYLTTFERTAERECWPKEQWAGLLAPFLSGEPQKAYFDLETQDAMDYGKLKKEILTRLGVTVSVRAQRVHTWVYSMDKPPRSQMHDLIHLTKKWLQPEVLTGPQMVERVVMDQYLRSLPVTLRKWVSHGDPKDADQMVEMVERLSRFRSPYYPFHLTQKRISMLPIIGQMASCQLPGRHKTEKRIVSSVCDTIKKRGTHIPCKFAVIVYNEEEQCLK
ncbi:uncharacterized protein PAF06_019992 [Gastrophryne carolinensis]